MAIVSRLTSTGTLLSNVLFDEVTQPTIRVTTSAYQATLFDEVTYNTTSPAIKNLITYTEELDNASWGTHSGITVTANAITAPDGATTADQLTGDGVSNGYLTKTGVSYVSGTTYTWSCYFKAGTATTAVILVYSTYFGGGSNKSTVFDLSNGTVTSSGASASGIVSAGNGWYRCWQSHTCVISSSAGHQFVRMNVVSGNFYAWGYQVEEGSSPTIYQGIAAASTLVTPLFAKREDRIGTLYVTNSLDEVTTIA